MGWKQYHLIFRMLSNVHVGYRRVGNVMMARRYVHGRVLRGAIINCLAMNIFNEESNAYQAASEDLKNNIRNTYLWPAIPKDNHEKHPTDIPEKVKWDRLQAIFPFEETNGLRYFYPSPRGMKKEEFDYMFMSTEQRTSVMPDTSTAEEGMLFEIESISNFTRTGKPVFLVGTLWVSDAIQESPELFLANMILGGERTYGWGRGVVHIEQVVTATHEPDKIQFDGYTPSHIISDNLTMNSMARVEVLAGWEWVGRKHQLTHRVSYKPGCQVDGSTEFEIDEYGIWIEKSD